jgi:hypothetical protein
MSGRLEGTVRGGLRRPSLLLASGLAVALALMADVSASRTADGYAVAVGLPGWPLVIAASALGALWLARRWRARGAAVQALEAASGGAIADSPAPDPSSAGATALGAADAVCAAEEDGATEDPNGALAGRSELAVRPNGVGAGPNGAVASENGAAAGVRPVARIAVRSPRAITLIDVEEISHIEAVGRYARIHAGGRQYLAQHSLAELERMLDGSRFVRVHRSAIVNLERIRSLRTSDYRDFELLLDDGAAVHLSRNYRTRLEAALGVRF